MAVWAWGRSVSLSLNNAIECCGRDTKEVICGTKTAIKGLSITLYRQVFFTVRPLWLYITDARKTKKPAVSNRPAFLY